MVATLREQMHAELTRTDALRPLVWPVAGLLAALSVAIAERAPGWLLISLAVALGVILSVYIGHYTYFAVTDPDALRSEKYKLQKMAIEHGLLGDSQIGLQRADNLLTAARTIDALPSSEPLDD